MGAKVSDQCLDVLPAGQPEKRGKERKNQLVLIINVFLNLFYITLHKCLLFTSYRLMTTLGRLQVMKTTTIMTSIAPIFWSRFCRLLGTTNGEIVLD